MTDDIVTRLRDGNHDMDARNCASCDAFCCECELCDCCVEALNSRNEAADEIERLRKQRNELAWAIAWFLNGGSREKLEQRFALYEEELEL